MIYVSVCRQGALLPRSAMVPPLTGAFSLSFFWLTAAKKNKTMTNDFKHDQQLYSVPIPLNKCVCTAANHFWAEKPPPFLGQEMGPPCPWWDLHPAHHHHDDLCASSAAQHSWIHEDSCEIGSEHPPNTLCVCVCTLSCCPSCGTLQGCSGGTGIAASSSLQPETFAPYDQVYGKTDQ